MTDFLKDLGIASGVYTDRDKREAAVARVLAAHLEMEAQANREQQRADQAERTVAEMRGVLRSLVDKRGGAECRHVESLSCCGTHDEAWPCCVGIARALLASPEVASAADGWVQLNRSDLRADKAEAELAALKQEHAELVATQTETVVRAEQCRLAQWGAEKERDAARAEVDRLHALNEKTAVMRAALAKEPST